MKKIYALSMLFILAITVLQVGSIQVTPAHAKSQEYYLTINIVGTGSVSWNGSNPYDPGDVVEFTATSISAHWEFSHWSGDLTGTDNPAYLTMDSDKTVTAHFTEIPEYYLYVNIIGTGIVSWNGSNPYDPGDVVVITATPGTGWEFDGWSGDLTGTTNPEYLTMDSNKTVTCTFTEIPEYYLSVNIIGNGIVTYNGSNPYDPGDVVVLTAYPDSGWYFDGWSGDLTGMANPDTILMDQNKSVTVTFKEIPEYYLSVNIIGNGIVTVNGSNPYDPGDVLVMTAYPDSGWEFSGWSGDLTGTTNPEYLTMDSNKTVTCTFTEIPDVRDVEAVSQCVTDNEVMPGDVVNIEVTVRNNGDVIESFDLTCYYDSVAIGTIRVIDLAPGEIRVVTFTWDTTGVPMNEYAITAWADSSDEIVEVDEANNWCTMPLNIFVVPELPLGTIMAALSMFAALIGYAGFKRIRTKQPPQ